MREGEKDMRRIGEQAKGRMHISGKAEGGKTVDRRFTRRWCGFAIRA